MSVTSMGRVGWVVIGIAGCQGPETNFETLEPTLAVSPEVLELGPVGLPLSGTGQVFVQNAGKADLDVEVTLAGGTEVFALEGATDHHLTLAIEPGEQVALNVVFTPDTFRDFDGRLEFTSNDPDHPTWTVPIHGTGIDLPLPVIEILPSTNIEVVDVQPGEGAILNFTIHNAGDAPLELIEVTLSGDDVERFVPVYTPLPGTKVFPGNDYTLGYSYIPEDSDGDDAIVTIVSNDPVNPETLVQLVGNGGNGFDRPVAVIDCPTTVFLTGPEWVHFDGTESYDPGGTELSYQWEVVARPPGSEQDVPVDPDDQAEADVYVDIAGTYTVSLVVTNALDTPSETAFCLFSAVPEDDIHVELTWDTPSADVDLHLAQAGFPLFADPEDCSWCNESPDWGESGNDDDPRLDIDDVAGLGPENINVLVPADGDYLPRVHYFAEKGDEALVATVRIWAGGTEVGVEQRVMVHNEVWDVGTVSWPSASFVANPAPNYPAPVRICQ